MLMFLFIIMILVITLSSLRITAIYFNVIAYRNLLYTGVLLSILVLLVGSGVEGYVGLFPVTIITQSMNVFIYLVGALVLLLGSTSTLIGNGKGLPALVSYLFIVLFTVLGMSSLISSSDLVSMFLSIELQSFAVYIYNEAISVAEFVYNFILSNFTVFCEEISELPVAAEFQDLHLTDNFAAAIKLLKGLAGIYCIKCVVTGTMYIGSAVNLGKRMNEHFICSSNAHLRNAMVLYGIAAFIFIVVEFVEILPDMTSAALKAILLAREQVYLD
jgi:hypothetical protein